MQLVRADRKEVMMNQLQQTMKHRLAAAAAVLMLVPAMAQAQTKLKPGFNLFSPEQDVEVGRQSAAQAEQQLPLVNDSAIEAYINDMGQRLAANAPGPKFQYRFRVVNASDINAFALPGGFIYINRGTIEAAKSDGEVAGVLAHEISHDALRHGTHQASKAYVTQAGLSILGGVLGGKVGAGTAQIINAVGGFGLNAIFLKYSRDAENQADLLGAQIMSKSGYNPNEMASFFETLQKSSNAKVATWLSSHPQTSDRIKNVRKESTKLNTSAAMGVRSARFQDVQSTFKRMSPARKMEEIAQTAATNSGGSSTQQQGRVSVGQVEAPSRSLATYTSQSRVFQVAYPSNWQVVGEGQNGVSLSPRGGYGEVNGNPEIVYGAIVSHYDPQGNSSMSAEESTDELVSVLRQNSPYLKVQSKQKIKVEGGTALAAVLRGTSPTTGLLERVTVVTRQLSDGHLVYMLFITPDRDASAYSPVLKAMVNSFRIDPAHRH
jgi:Zn-dependent protease with chaperone function